MRLDPSAQAAERRLVEAARSGTPCAPIRDLVGVGEIATAYAIQAQISADRVLAGDGIVGRKIGLTNVRVQQQLGVEQPDFGVIFESRAYGSEEPIETAIFLQPKIEAEIAFVLARDITSDRGPITREMVTNAIAFAAPALEIVDSRIADWDISIVDTVADNASFGGFLLGAERLPIADIDVVAEAMILDVNGVEHSSGSGADCLGDPIEAVRWLAQTVDGLGSPLRAGEIVLSGALGPMVEVDAGHTVTARFSNLGTVVATFI